MRRSLIVVLLSLAAAASPAMAQQAPAPAAGAVVASAPGKAVAASKARATAVVTAIDLASRTVTLKGPKGRVFDVVAGDEVRNLEQVRVGDHVVVEYVRALAMELVKNTGIRESTERSDAVRAEAGQKPGGAVGRHITAIADVVDVNRKAKTITLKGPKGNLVELAVENPEQFKVVKKGDQVRVDYVEAVAVAVEPAPAKAPAKKK